MKRFFNWIRSEKRTDAVEEAVKVVAGKKQSIDRLKKREERIQAICKLWNVVVKTSQGVPLDTGLRQEEKRNEAKHLVHMALRAPEDDYLHRLAGVCLIHECWDGSGPFHFKGEEIPLLKVNFKKKGFMPTHLRQIKQLLSEAARVLELVRIPSPRLEAEVLLAHFLSLDRLDLYKCTERILSEAEENCYRELIQRRAEGNPTAYLRGKKEFFSRVFQVGPGVLIPRAETELLVEEGLRVLEDIGHPFLLELGTGSGAVIVSLLAERSDARAMAIDLSGAALDYAGRNAEIHQVSDRLQFLEGNLFEPLEEAPSFDLIVSNPPYIPSDEISSDLRFEPREAFDGGADGLSFYRKILQEAWKFLKPTGYLLLEIGSTNQPSLKALIGKSGAPYSSPRFIKDLAGHDRLLVLKKTS